MVEVLYEALDHGVGLPLPFYQSKDAAGMDLYAAVEAEQNLYIAPQSWKLVPCGFRMELPRGYEAQVRPRSGLAFRHGITVLNSPGTIDADYRGEVAVLLINHSREVFTIVRGDRIAQMVIAPVSQAQMVQVETLGSTERGSGGFGSTGIKGA
jgi:dUTP pyrophosphatase